jgi:hypothetical protein
MRRAWLLMALALALGCGEAMRQPPPPADGGPPPVDGGPPGPPPPDVVTVTGGGGAATGASRSAHISIAQPVAGRSGAQGDRSVSFGVLSTTESH